MTASKWMTPFVAALSLGAGASAQIIITDKLPGTFIDISATGTPLGLGNDDEVDIPLTVFLGNLIVPAGSTLTIANNGGVGVNTPIKNLDPTNAPLPSPGAFGGDKALLPFWDDPGSDFGDVWFQERPDLVIIQWEREFKDDPFPPRDTGIWQVQIAAGAEQEECFAQYLYRDIQQPFPRGGAIATIGFQGGVQFNTVQWSFNQPFAVSNETVLSVCEVSDNYSTGFEPPLYTGSPGGVSVVGQEGWTLSPTLPSEPHKVYTYTGNALGLARNPRGGRQFLGGRSIGATFARAQHDINWGAGSSWVISYDLAPNHDGVLPAAINLASTSDQRNDLAATRQFIALKNFVNGGDPIGGGWKSEFNVFDAGGGALDNQLAFTNLRTNHWYRESIHLDFSTNRITRVTMTDLTTNLTQNFVPPGWFLTGGANPTNPMPDAFRFFVGGSAGNIMGWDNLDIRIAPPSCPCACNYDNSTGPNVCDIFDFLAFQNHYAAGDPCACNEDISTGPNVCDIFDFLAFQNGYSAGCP